MTPRVAALALAAIPLSTAPALADAPAHATQTALGGATLSLADASISISVGDNRWRGRNGRHYRTNQWGQGRREVRQLRRDALHRCEAAIVRQGYRTGFRDVDVDDDVRIRQLGPRGFRVRFDEVEFEGRRREFDRHVNCTVRRGHVVSLSGIPEPGRRHRGRGHSRDWDWNDRGHHRDHRGRTGPGGHRPYGELRGGRGHG